MKLIYQNRTGLYPEHDSGEVIRVDMSHNPVRLTIPAREALQAAGATITPVGDGLWTLVFGDTMPDGLVAARTTVSEHLAVRREDEPEYPGEVAGYAAWEQVDFASCPECGAPVLWYEAGYVPGYRVCVKPPHHHLLAVSEEYYVEDK